MRGWAEQEHQKWQEGKVSGGVYHGEQEHLDVLNAAFDSYSLANPLHADLWPSVNKYEVHIMRMLVCMRIINTCRWLVGWLVGCRVK